MIRYTTNTNKVKEFIEVSKVNLYEVIDQLMREEGLALLEDHKWIPHQSRHAHNMYAHTEKGKDGEERIIYLGSAEKVPRCVVVGACLGSGGATWRGTISPGQKLKQAGEAEMKG